VVGRSPTRRRRGLQGWCATCGTPVDLREWHLVALPPEPGDDLYVFCRPACKADFLPGTDPEDVAGPEDVTDSTRDDPTNGSCGC